MNRRVTQITGHSVLLSEIARVPPSRVPHCVQPVEIPVPRISHVDHFPVRGLQGSIYPLLNICLFQQIVSFSDMAPLIFIKSGFFCFVLFFCCGVDPEF